MLVLNRFVVAPERTAEFTEKARTALAVFATQQGYRGGELTRALDDPRHWCLLTTWASVGAYRRALSDLQVRLQAVPLLAEAINEPSAYEIRQTAAPGGEVVAASSDVAPGWLTDRALRNHD